MQLKHTLLSLCCAIGLLASNAHAQKGKIVKNAYTNLSARRITEESLHNLRMLPQTPYPAVPPAEFVNASGVRLNPNGERHAITPSATTILGSDKVLRSEPVIKAITMEDLLISPRERLKWRNLRELFTSASYLQPFPVEKLGYNLRHPVPAQTFQHLKTLYTDTLERIQAASALINNQVIYASLPGEATRPTPEELGEINLIVYPIIIKLRELRTALPDDPYLAKQQELWEQTFATFNPLLASLIVSPAKSVQRTDGRIFTHREFNLYNPDGTDYLLPRSETMLVDPEDLEEMDSYAAVREKQLNPPITQENAALEREELLPQIPSGMHIALINDDTLPRINFANWAKNGYLGNGATISVFPDGSQFMDGVRAGVKYDLIITDLLVPYGGKAMMSELRELDANAIVIASSKFDRGEEDEDKLFNLGFDGYLWYNTNLNEGAYGYIEYLRAMKNYFYYKQKYNWQR